MNQSINQSLVVGGDLNVIYRFTVYHLITVTRIFVVLSDELQVPTLVIPRNTVSGSSSTILLS